MNTSGERINYFAETDHRGRRIKFGIKEADRARHMYVIGKTGMGKSTLLENLAVQDIQNGEGVCFIDPHGSSAETLLAYVPPERVNDVVYFAPFDQEFPLALNVMEDIGADKRSLVASGLIGSFKKVWIDAWSPRMEYILNNALLALLEAPDSTLLGVNRMFADKAYREHVLSYVKDPSVLAFWKDEFAKYSDKFATEATAAIQNKVGQFAANPLIRNIVGQPTSTFDIRKLMDEKKIFIVNLSKGRIGEGNAALIGSMLVTKIYLAAMSRAEVHGSELAKLPPFYLYVDEFQSFANESFADILSEARKYKLSLTVAHQYIEQMSDEVRAAVFGNVGTMITFRVGSYDAEVLEKEFAPHFLAQDIVNLGFAQIYLKLMINNVGSQPFSATTLPRPEMPPNPLVSEVVASSRRQFGKSRAQVEEDIRKWHEPVGGRNSEEDNAPRTRKIAPGTRESTGQPRSMIEGGRNLAERPNLDQVLRRAQSSPSRTDTNAVARSGYLPRPENMTPRVERQRTESRSPVTQTVERHQPFKTALIPVVSPVTEAVDREIQSEAVVESQPQQPVSLNDQRVPSPQRERVEIIKKEPEKTTQLSMLKNLTKKDKGPSEQHLSSLKSALQGILEKEQKTTLVKDDAVQPSAKPSAVITAQQQPPASVTTSAPRNDQKQPSVQPVPYLNRQQQNNQHVSPQQRVQVAPVLLTQVGEARTQQQPEREQVVRISPPTPPIRHDNLQTGGEVVLQQPKTEKVERSTYNVPPEIPEDVLRRVLGL